MEQRKEIKVNENESKGNGGIQIIFFDRRNDYDYELEMRKWERVYHDTDYLDKDYLVVRKIDESQFR